jgi:Flp pilus assembly pilin Flp
MTRFGEAKTATSRLFRDTRGAEMVEYIVLIGTVAITSSIAMVGLGVAVYRNFAFVRNMLLLPFP